MLPHSEIHDLVEQDRFELMMRCPFYGRIICSVELVVVNDPQVRLACTDYRRIFISGDAYPALPEKMRLAVLAHEILHIALRHAFRIGDRDKNRFEKAADIEVHFILIESFPDPYGIAVDKKWRDLTAEQIYELLPPCENKTKPQSDHCSPNDNQPHDEPPDQSGDGIPADDSDAQPDRFGSGNTEANGGPSDQQDGGNTKADDKPSTGRNAGADGKPSGGGNPQSSAGDSSEDDSKSRHKSSRNKKTSNNPAGENTPGTPQPENGNQSGNTDRRSDNNGNMETEVNAHSDQQDGGNTETDGDTQSDQPIGRGNKQKRSRGFSNNHGSKQDGRGERKSGNGGRRNVCNDEQSDDGDEQEDEFPEFRPQFDAETEMNCIALSSGTMMDMRRMGDWDALASSPIRRLLKKLEKPRVGWQVLLRQYLRTCRGGAYSWSHPNRRFISRGLYLPGRTSIKSFNGIIALDTSPSTIDVLPRFVSELTGVFKAFGKFDLTIIECAARILQVWSVSSDKPMPDIERHQFKGDNGTDFTPVFEYVYEHHLTPNVLIYFTDGKGPCPENRPPYPVLWMLTKSGTKPAPWGQAICYEEN